MGTIQKPLCSDEQVRRSLIAGRTDWNGIDFLEVDSADHKILTVHFINPVGPLNPANSNDTQDIYGLATDLSKITISGGTRVVGIRPAGASRNPDGSITIVVDRPGDYSTYTLALNVPSLDILFSQIDFSFMATCPVDFDCRTDQICPPKEFVELLLDYQAKDYAGFRQMLLDLLPQLNPDFTETNPSDLGIALIELFAYMGDRLSYFQDAVVNEAYVDTLRRRISARRTGKLIDYRLHDGRNAFAYVHLAVDRKIALPMGTKILSRISMPLSGATSPPGPIVPGTAITADAVQTDPALAAVAAFETTFPVQLDPANNELFLHVWGNEECCLNTGTTRVFLYSVSNGVAVLPALSKGDYLLFEEVLGPLTGIAADADSSHRQIVRIDVDPLATTDPLLSNILVNGEPRTRQAADQSLPLLRVGWSAADKLTYPFCISKRLANGIRFHNISVARGNLVLADHGLTTTESIPLDAPVPEGTRFRPRLSHGPLTMQIQPALVEYDSTSGRLDTPRTDLTGNARQAEPAISLFARFPTGTELWTPATDLLESSPFDSSFVAEVDDDERAVLRFGDDEYGRSIAGATAVEAVYRIGNGLAGNVGAESLAHVAPDSLLPGITLVRNPLPAGNGAAPETIAEFQQWAPEAFRAVQYRAVTETDYTGAVKLLPQVRSAVAGFRWTGSWYTVFIGILPTDPNDLVMDSIGRVNLSPSLEQSVRSFLDGYRLTGYDMEIRPPQFLPLEIELLVCAAPGYFRSDVEQAVKAALSNQQLPDGTKGTFYPGNFVFGRPVYLSRIYAAVERVQGVDSLVVNKFRPFGQPDNAELTNGVIQVGPWQIAQLDNDPDFMEHGVLRVVMRGGKL